MQQALRASPLLRVLWRQDTSAYVPPVIPAGYVHGNLLVRYPSGSGAAVPLAELTAAQLMDRLKPGSSRRASAPLPSTTWRAKYLCENPSEGTSLAAFTPCCDADIAATLLAAVTNCRDAARTSHMKSGVSCRDALSALRVLHATVDAHIGLLAGAEALQTGVPVALVEASLAAACASMAATMRDLSASLAEEEKGGDCVSVSRVEKDFVASEDVALLRRLCGAGSKDAAHKRPSVAVCLTPAALSLSHGLRVVTDALSSGAFDRVVWCPSCDAALSATWLMHKLSDNAFASTSQGTPSEDASDGPHEVLSIVLGGGHEASVIPALHRSLSCVPDAGVEVAVLTHGMTTLAAERVSHACRKLHGPSFLKKEAKTDYSVPSIHVALDIPAACVIAPSTQSIPTEAPTPATSSSDSIADSCAALGKWVLTHSLSRTLPQSSVRHDGIPWHLTSIPLAVNAVESGGAPHMAGSLRVTLLFTPGAATTVGLMRYLATQGLGGASMRLGHSLDPSRRLGPLSSAAHMAAAKDLVKAATGKDSSARLVEWRQVCGGFDFPLTAAEAGGFFYVPVILYTSLDAIAREVKAREAEASEGASCEHVNAYTTAVKEVCTSVRRLTQVLEEEHGGTAGACVFVCAYNDAQQDASSSEGLSSTELARLVKEAAAGIPTMTSSCATIPGSCRQATPITIG